MEIPGNVGIYGFRRYDMGEQGAVFLRLETPKDDARTAEIKEDMLHYYGTEYVSYSVKVPLPLAPQVTGAVLIERTSKSRYSVAAWGNGKVMFFSATNVREIRDGTAWLWGKVP